MLSSSKTRPATKQFRLLPLVSFLPRTRRLYQPRKSKHHPFTLNRTFQPDSTSHRRFCSKKNPKRSSKYSRPWTKIKSVSQAHCLARSIVTLYPFTAKPKVALRRLGQTFVLDRVKTEEAHENHDTENIDIYMRPKITDHVDLADAHVDQP